MQLVCCACGESFEFTERDIEFYKKMGGGHCQRPVKNVVKHTYLR